MPSSHDSGLGYSLGDDAQPDEPAEDSIYHPAIARQQRVDWVAEPHISLHLSPVRLLGLATSGESPTLEEAEHIRSCDSCRKHWVIHRRRVECHTDQTVPEVLRQEVFVTESPTAFRDGSISSTSWQFGLIPQLRGSDPARFHECVEFIVRRLVRHLRSELLLLPAEDIVIAAYGQFVAWCAEKAAKILRTSGFRHISVVPVNGAERLRFGISPATFVGARVVCLSDVAYSGRVLKRMRELCEESGSKGEAYLLAFVQQTKDDVLPPAEFHGLWTEPAHQLWTYGEFLVEYPKEAHSIRCFEPELGLSTESAIAEETAISFLFNEDCIKFDAVVEGNHYLVAADTLKMLGVNSSTKPRASDRGELASNDRELFVHNNIPPAFNALTTRMADRLCAMLLSMNGTTCLVVHEYRQSRALKIAEHLRLVLRQRGLSVPIVRVGQSDSCHLNFTKRQVRNLRKFHSAIVIDSAMRTGASLSAMWLAISEATPHLTASTAGLVVASSRAESTLTHTDFDSTMVVHSVVQLPMLPPTESLASRTVKWKHEMLNIFETCDQESQFPEFHDLAAYCRENLKCDSRRDLEPVSLEPATGLIQSVSGPAVRWFLNRILLWPRFSPDRKRDVMAMLISLDDYAWLAEKDWLVANRRWLSHSDHCQQWRLFAVAILSLHFRTLKEDCPYVLKQTAMNMLLSLRENILSYRGQKGLFGEPCWREDAPKKALVSLLQIVERCIRQGLHKNLDNAVG